MYDGKRLLPGMPRQPGVPDGLLAPGGLIAQPTSELINSAGGARPRSDIHTVRRLHVLPLTRPATCQALSAASARLGGPI